MSKIRIKNFGPIKEGFDSPDGFMDIKKVTVFIGDQGSGKSTVAKLISTLLWMEKAVNRGEISPNVINFHRFQDICMYQGIKNYILPQMEVEYIGDAYRINIKYMEPPIICESISNNYIVPKIIYVSAERNFLSTIKSAFDVTGMPDHLTDFAEELKRAQIEIAGNKVELPIGHYSYEYDEYKDVSEISGPGFQINLLEASSGLQSIVPLYLVSSNLSFSIAGSDDNNDVNLSPNQRIRRNGEITKITLDSTLSDADKKILVSKAYAKYHNKCFINIVEEPEQNLYPASQRKILESLFRFNNLSEGNKLIMTTHSPYLINFLSIAIQGDYLQKKLNETKRDDLIERLKEIVPIESCIDREDVVIFELDENGYIRQLPAYEGIPSDKNYLNQSLAECNQLFDSLLEIEQEI